MLFRVAGRRLLSSRRVPAQLRRWSSRRPGGFVASSLRGATSTAVLKFYDNASAASGTVIGIVPSGATAGQVFDLEMPAGNGITAGLLSGSAAVTVSFY